jgi:oligopeptide transport system substrate-binding protein
MFYMKKSKWSFLLTLVLVLSMFLAACSGGEEGTSEEDTGGDDDNATEPTEETAEAQVLNLLASSEIPTMDSLQATDSVSFNVMNQVFEGLYRLDSENQPTPGVAEDVDISEDGLTYTFTLNPDAKWSNGDPVTANDFVYSWRKAVSEETVSPYAYIMGPIKNSTAIAGLSAEGTEHELYNKPEELGVKAEDDSTLVVELAYNAPYFLGLTGFPTLLPQNEEFVESQGGDYALETDNLIYNGPFVLNEWKHEESWQMIPNEEYWDRDTVKLEEANYRVIKDTATGVNLYETGEADMAGLSAEFVDQYSSHEDYMTISDTAVYFLRLNQKNEALANVNIRKAFDMAWDKQAMTDVILNNGSQPAYYLVPKEFTFSPDGEDFRETNGTFGEYNPEEAKALWEKGLEEIGKDSVTLELLNYDSESSKQVGEYIQNQLQENLEGLTIEIKPQPFKQKLELEDKGEYDFAFAGWGPDYQDPMTFLDMFITGGAHNQMAYSDEEFDTLIEKAVAETNVEKRWEYLLEAEKVFFDKQPISPMYQRGGAVLQQDYVKNYYRHPFGADSSLKWVEIQGKEQ